MATGILSGKYHTNKDCGPEDARMNLFKGINSYMFIGNRLVLCTVIPVSYLHCSCFVGRYSEGESRYKLQSPKVKAAVKVVLFFYGLENPLFFLLLTQ